MRKVSLFIVMLVLAINVKAQGNFIVPFIGLNESGALFYGASFMDKNVKYDLSQYRENIVGFGAGVNYRYESNRRFVIETGINYNKCGYAFQDLYKNDNKILWDYKVKYNHFSVPVMFGYMFVVGRNKIFTITPKLGIQLGYYTNMRQSYNYINSDNQEVNFNEKKKLSYSFDVAQTMGLELGWCLSSYIDLFVSVSERLSLINMFNVDDYEKGVFKVEKDVTMRGNTYNYSFGLNAGVRIRLKGAYYR